MKKIINTIYLSLFVGLLILNVAMGIATKSGTINVLTLIQSANANSEYGVKKYFKTYCSCSKGSGMNWEWCNMKTNCIESELGDLDSCTSTSCFSGCSC